MQIEKRRLPVYILLNCLTLGIYGFVVSNQIGNEVDQLCAGDDEEPRFGYGGAVLFRAIPVFIGLVVGLVFGIIASTGVDNIVIDLFDNADDLLGTVLGFVHLDDLFGASIFGSFFSIVSDYKGITIISFMIVGVLLFGLLGRFISRIYLNYWWYKQTGRLKLNAHRYGITVKETGTDTYLFRTVLNVFLAPITLLLNVFALFIPVLICYLITLGKSTGAVLAALIILFLFLVPWLIFNAEISAGASFSTYFVFKNMNRYSDAVANGAAGFDRLGYNYYPSRESFYPGYLPRLLGGDFAGKQPIIVRDESKDDRKKDIGRDVVDHADVGSLVGLKGSCAGYSFDLNPGEEIVIGKDAKLSSVVIDPAYKEVSRKHVGITYEVLSNAYRVVDYSSNGTKANGNRLTKDSPTVLPKGTIIELANGKNSFRLG